MADPKWEMADTVAGTIFGAVMAFLGLTGLVNRRFEKVHARIADTEEKATDRMAATEQLVQGHAVDIATLMAQQEANQAFQERVDRTLVGLTEKNDEQLRILAKLEGALSSRLPNNGREL